MVVGVDWNIVGIGIKCGFGLLIIGIILIGRLSLFDFDITN